MNHRLQDRRPLRRARALTGTLTALGLTGALLAAAATPTTAAPADQAPAADVSPHAAQTIENIGASGAWWPNDLANFSPSVQARAAALLFSPDGLALSSYRYNIGGGGTGVTTPERAPEDFLADDGSYDWSKDKGGRTFLHYAARHGVDELIGFVNSAPAEWKTNGKSCGGHLKPEHDQDFARYLADLVQHFTARGVELDHISPFNEPTNSFDSCGQEGMLVDVDRRDDVVRAVGAELRSRHDTRRTGLIADESSSTDAFVDEVPEWLSQPGTAPYIDRLAHHTYNNPDDGGRARILELARAYDKPSWSTEICCFGKGGTGWNKEYDPTIDNALLMSRIIHKDFAVAHDSAFQWWTALSNKTGVDPEAGGGAGAAEKNGLGWNDGLIYYDENYATTGNQKLYMTKRYYALGQYSKFVRPGSVLHNVTGAPSGVEVTAYDHKGRWTVVVNNHNTTATPLDLRFHSKAGALEPQRAVRTSAGESWAAAPLPSVDGATVSATLPARSITTYVIGQRADTSATAVTGALRGAHAGKCLVADGTGARIASCTGEAGQTWSYGADGALRGADGGCLGVSDGGVLVAGDCADAWLLNGNGQVVHEATGRCLDVSGWATAEGSRVVLWTCTGGANQSWARR
ncbi:glycoside hydrolase [Streptomyces sp. TRM64462]|uniref:glycoside hydrolase n=1 Tax=Streptomyces sp. TRM64462 TaxID=2741726 RepID=UPI001586439C|nr:glycoside hydrolase [Streptomyces sp. TRM64462]